MSLPRTESGAGSPLESLRAIAEAYSSCTRCSDLGVPAFDRRLSYWELAEAVRPDRVRVLFIAESPPHRNRRGRWSYFYLPREEKPEEDASTLFWALAQVLALPESCGVTYAEAYRGREEWKPKLLAEFRRRELWLVDTAKCPVNHLDSAKLRREALRRCAEHWLWREIRALEPESIVLIKATVRDLVEPLVTAWGYGPRLLGSDPIPHPGSGQIENFRRAMRLLIGRHPDRFAGPQQKGR